MKKSEWLQKGQQMKQKKRNILISFDPNLRPLLWEDLNLAREQIDFWMFCMRYFKNRR